MYADEIIQEMKNPNRWMGITRKLLERKKLEKYIKSSQKFYCGHIDDIKIISGTKYHRLFDDKEYVLPYKTCFFSWQVSPTGGGTASSRRAILAARNNNGWDAMVFFYVNQRREWATHGLWHKISPGIPWNQSTMAGFNVEPLSGNDSHTCIFPAPTPLSQQMVNAIGSKFFLEALPDDGADLNVLETILKLLHCKNIKVVDVVPPRKLNKKRTRRKKEPLFIYKTLVIVKPGVTKTSNEPCGSEKDSRVHLCRGHFKEYTPEKPLFGKHIGRYWWEPQVRGNIENGMVTKKYEILSEDHGPH